MVFIYTIQTSARYRIPMRFVGGDSLQYTNEILKKMADKRRAYNPKYAFYYMKMHDEYKDKKYKNRSERIESCLDLWVFDKYEKNKILDLKKVNRCYNNRFCPNCKAFDAAKFLHYIKPQIEELLSNFANRPFFLTNLNGGTADEQALFSLLHPVLEYEHLVFSSVEQAFQMMKNFFGTDFAEKQIVVGEGDTLSLGKHNLTFVIGKYH